MYTRRTLGSWFYLPKWVRTVGTLLYMPLSLPVFDSYVSLLFYIAIHFFKVGIRHTPK